MLASHGAMRPLPQWRRLIILHENRIQNYTARIGITDRRGTSLCVRGFDKGSIRVSVGSFCYLLSHPCLIVSISYILRQS
jgi:hypothetical protein